MPMIATTIINSIRVKPCCTFLMFTPFGHRYGSDTLYASLIPTQNTHQEVLKAAKTAPHWPVLVGGCPTVSAVTFVSRHFRLSLRPGISRRGKARNHGRIAA